MFDLAKAARPYEAASEAVMGEAGLAKREAPRPRCLYAVCVRTSKPCERASVEEGEGWGCC